VFHLYELNLPLSRFDLRNKRLILSEKLSGLTLTQLVFQPRLL
jgi:hypothetical protein